MRDYDELEDYQDDFEEWAEWWDSFDRERKKRTQEGLASVGLTSKDLADLVQEWDDLVKDAAYPERQILKKWLKEEQEEEETE